MRSLWLLASLATVAAAYFAGDVFIPIAVALFLSALLEPAVEWLERHGLARTWGATIALFGFLVLLGAVGWGCSQPFSRLAGELPQYSTKLKGILAAVERESRRLERSTQTAAPPPAQARQTAEAVQQASTRSSWKDFAMRGLGTAFQAAGIAVFIPFLMIFFLIEKDLLLGSLGAAFAGILDMGPIAEKAGRMTRAFFFGNFLTGVGLAAGHYGVFAGLGLENAVGLGILTGFISVIPILGLPLALILPLAQGLLQFSRPAPFIALTVSVAALHLLAANLAIPRLVGAHVKINATAATVGLLFWGWLWGITGFLLAVPLTALIKILLDGSKETTPLADLLATKPEHDSRWFGRRAHGAHAASR